MCVRGGVCAWQRGGGRQVCSVRVCVLWVGYMQVVWVGREGYMLVRCSKVGSHREGRWQVVEGVAGSAAAKRASTQSLSLSKASRLRRCVGWGLHCQTIAITSSRAEASAMHYLVEMVGRQVMPMSKVHQPTVLSNEHPE